MKINNGCWLLKAGYQAFAPKEVYYTTVTDTMVTLCTPTHHIVTR